MNAQMQLMVKTPPGSSITPVHAGLLQRKQRGEHEPDEDCPRCSKGLLNLQGKSANLTEPSSVPPIVHEVLNSPGQPLDNETRAFMEPRFGHDFSKVRVHTDERAAESARAVNALAYTVGRDIVFREEQYRPATRSGRQLLTHELVHTIQQDGETRLTPDIAFISAAEASEREAQRVENAITEGQPISTVLHEPIKIARQTSNQPVTPPTQPAPEESLMPDIFVHNTELGGLSVGNFDFHFKGCAILIWVWLKFKFTSDINPTEQEQFKIRFLDAIHGVWSNSGWFLTGDSKCPCPIIPITIHAEENPRSFYHKLVDVERKTDIQRRPCVISDINVNFYSSNSTFAHEFGHVLGLYDEYDGGFFENIMFWHRNQPNDPNALMNLGTELRPRYFENYRRRVQETGPKSCRYSISAPVPPVVSPLGDFPVPEEHSKESTV